MDIEKQKGGIVLHIDFSIVDMCANPFCAKASKFLRTVYCLVKLPKLF